MAPSSSVIRAFALLCALVSCLLGNASAFQSISPLASSTRLLSTDAGQVRGDTSTSSTRLYSSVAILAALDTIFQTSPYTAAAITCGFKASAADWIAQKRDYRKREEKERKAAAAAAVDAQDEESTRTDNTSMIYNPNDSTIAAKSTTAAANGDSSDSKTDWKRNAAYLAYGSLYQGATQEFVYNHCYPYLFGVETTLPVVLTKVVFDLCIQTTLVTLPIAYLTKSIIYRYSFKEAMRRYYDDIRNHGLLKKYFLLWGPVQCLTFSIVPEHWRVTFIAFVSFFWIIILSTIASKTALPSAKVEDDDDVAIPECSFEDGTTCNIDG